MMVGIRHRLLVRSRKIENDGFRLNCKRSRARHEVTSGHSASARFENVAIITSGCERRRRRMGSKSAIMSEISVLDQ